MTRRGIRGKPFQHGTREKPLIESGNSVSAKVLVNALRSGTLNLQNREMTVIPDDVYRLNDPDLLKSLVGDSDDLKWWETEPINKLYLCSNKITTVTPAISGLNSLTLLDLRDNQLESIPEELSQLEVLVRLELSHNRLTHLPSVLGPALQHISLNNNNFETVPPVLATLRSLQALDMRENKLSSVGELPCCLQSLTVDDNKISSLHVENHPTLTSLVANSNTIATVSISNLPKLKILSLRINKLEQIPPITNCPQLSELLLGKNFLSSLQFVESSASSLAVLDVSDNKISTLPAFITCLTQLRRLDLTNNDINHLPPQLALMDDLDALLVEGNPMRAIRRDIVSKGTVAIKEYLKLKISPDDLPEQGPTIPDIAPDEVMLQTKALALTHQSGPIDSALWDQALVCGIARLSIQHCALAQLPGPVCNLRATLQDLDLASNSLQSLPAEIGQLGQLKKLNLINNKLRELPLEFSDLCQLEDLNLGQNKFDSIPECVYNLGSLCNFIISNNNISTVEPAKLMQMPSLVCLDLENNNIGRLPPELSLIPNIRTLLVMGNTFKIPRADVLAKGSTEVLAWLKNKVPQP